MTKDFKKGLLVGIISVLAFAMIVTAAQIKLDRIDLDVYDSLWDKKKDKLNKSSITKEEWAKEELEKIIIEDGTDEMVAEIHWHCNRMLSAEEPDKLIIYLDSLRVLP